VKERKERQAEKKRTLIENMHFHVHNICAVSLRKSLELNAEDSGV